MGSRMAGVRCIRPMTIERMLLTEIHPRILGDLCFKTCRFISPIFVQRSVRKVGSCAQHSLSGNSMSWLGHHQASGPHNSLTSYRKLPIVCLDRCRTSSVNCSVDIPLERLIKRTQGTGPAPRRRISVREPRPNLTTHGAGAPNASSTGDAEVNPQTAPPGGVAVDEATARSRHYNLTFPGPPRSRSSELGPRKEGVRHGQWIFDAGSSCYDRSARDFGFDEQSERKRC